MKKLVLVFSTMAILLGFGATTAGAALYASGNLALVALRDAHISDGVDTGELSFDPGAGVTFALGGNLGVDLLRAEIEFAHRSNQLDELTVNGLGTTFIDGDLRATTLMGNLFCDLAPGTSLSPFFGAGIGLANLNLDLERFGDENDTVLAYQLAAGLAVAVSPQLDIDLQYRYLATEDPNFAGLKAEYATHNLMAGVRVKFQ